MQGKIVVRKTPNCRHLYTATMRGFATYGWGNSPEEARIKFRENVAKSGETQNLGSYEHATAASL